MIKQRKIELLAPAKNLECGMAAVDHGADAVYIGAPRFGARAAAGNSLEDIAALVQYAHLYNVRIYVTVNTILRDEELKDTEEMIWELYRAGVDALIVQDMGLLELNLPPIPLHASTQMDNRTPKRQSFWQRRDFVRLCWRVNFHCLRLARYMRQFPKCRLKCLCTEHYASVIADSVMSASRVSGAVPTGGNVHSSAAWRSTWWMRTER